MPYLTVVALTLIWYLQFGWAFLRAWKCFFFALYFFFFFYLVIFAPRIFALFCCCLFRSLSVSLSLSYFLALKFLFNFFLPERVFCRIGNCRFLSHIISRMPFSFSLSLIFSIEIHIWHFHRTTTTATKKLTYLWCKVTYRNLYTFSAVESIFVHL